ncbi:MAG: hypothetical protein K2X93_15665 [Candidatus Obscuribacterales bacterium]|nr:hypothetical protein [Candidatus Obscuribacterales bacterium]
MLAPQRSAQKALIVRGERPENDGNSGLEATAYGHTKLVCQNVGIRTWMWTVADGRGGQNTMARDVCLLTSDESPILRSEIIKLLEEKGRLTCINKQESDGNLADEDLIYSWQDKDLSERVLKAINEDNYDELTELGNEGKLTCCVLNVFGQDTLAEYSDDELKQLESDRGVDHATHIRDGKVQYETSGMLNSPDSDTLRQMMQLQFQTIQIIAYLRGGLLMDSGSLKEAFIEKGKWAEEDFVDYEDGNGHHDQEEEEEEEEEEDDDDDDNK